MRQPSPAIQRHIRVFQTHQFLDRFAMGLTVAVVALALTDRGMDLFQISLLFGIYSLTTMALELPFGGLADSIGRKPVFLAAVIASLTSLVLFISTSHFYVLALSFACIGFGRALRSGTLDAWFVETYRGLAPGSDVQPALAKAQWAGALGLGLGAIFGGLLPDVFGAFARSIGFSPYDVSYAASFTVMLGVFVFTKRAIFDAPHPIDRRALGQGFAKVPQMLQEAGRLTLRTPAIFLLLAALAFFLMATNPVEVLWPTHVKPMLDPAHANSVIGALTAVYFFSIAFGGFLSPYVSQIFKRAHAKMLAVTFIVLAGIQIILTLQSSAMGLAAIFALYSIGLGISETPASTLLHHCVADHQRSTMLSLRSLIQQLGGALGLSLAVTKQNNDARQS
jgi:MFS family permease